MKLVTTEERENVLKRYPNKTSEDTIDFIVRMERKYGQDLFDFSETEYFGYKERVIFKCRLHGNILNLLPKEALYYENPCEFCRLDRTFGVNSSTRKYISKAKLRFPEKSYKNQIIIGKLYSVFGENILDFSGVNYINNRIPIQIRCIKHNVWFERSFSVLMRGESDCPLCKKEKTTKLKIKTRKSREIEIPEKVYLKYPNKSEYTLKFISKVIKRFGEDRFDFSEMDEISSYNQKILVKCNLHHIIYETTPSLMLSNKCKSGGCPKCSKEIKLESKFKIFGLSEDDLRKSELDYPDKSKLTLLFISRIKYLLKRNSENENLFLFHKTDYLNEDSNIIITCSIHRYSDSTKEVNTKYNKK